MTEEGPEKGEDSSEGEAPPATEAAPAGTEPLEGDEAADREHEHESGSIRYAAEAETAVWDESSLKEMGALGAASGGATAPDAEAQGSPSVEVDMGQVTGEGLHRPSGDPGPSLVITLLIAASAGVLVYVLVSYLL